MGVIIGAVLVLIVLCGIVFIAIRSKKENAVGMVDSVYWSRSVPILDLVNVTKQEWLEDIPQDAELGNCEQRYHHTSSEPEEGAEEVCGTPYSKDTGSGYAEVVQDCEYRVYQDYCEYSAQEWQVVDTVELQGSDLNPRWPEVNLSRSQRTGDQEELYKVIFQTEKGNFTYSTHDEQEYLQFQPGSEWMLEINGFWDIVSVEPK
jgi:hypothetical protein